MRKLDDTGSLALPLLIFVTLLLFVAIGFGSWAYMSRQDFKTNVDKKIAVAVAADEKTFGEKKDAEYAERDKSPYKTYAGPAAYGSLTFQYPKSWSAYVVEKKDNSNPAVVGYMHPNIVPDINSKATLFALKFQVLDTPYNTVLKSYDGTVKSGKTKATAYAVPKVPNVSGMRLEGVLTSAGSQTQGVLVLLPLRTQTIQIWTEGDSFRSDFDSIILANMTFIP